MKKGETPDPGTEVSKEIAEPIILRFVEKFRTKDTIIPSNLPTACILNGVKNHSVLNSPNFLEYERLYLLFEYSRQLIEATATEISNYYTKRQPWEDYDFCVFDSEMRWCIGITHNDDIIVVDPEDLLSP